MDRTTEFIAACRDGNIRAVRRILAESEAQEGTPAIKKLLKSRNFESFIVACGNGHASVVKELVAYAKDTKDPQILAGMIKARDFEAFNRASANGHADVIEILVGLAAKLDQKGIRNNFASTTSLKEKKSLASHFRNEDKSPSRKPSRPRSKRAAAAARTPRPRNA